MDNARDGRRLRCLQSQSRPSDWQGGLFVMAIPAGSSPLGMFERLIAMFPERKLSFSERCHFLTWTNTSVSAQKIRKVITAFLWEKFFDHIDIQPKERPPAGRTDKDFAKNAASYEKLIRSYGGIDLLIGGVGEDGHIAFSEPGLFTGFAYYSG